jgi:ABC-type sulfate/molybdate transport systems ATPase subunit
VVTHDNRIFEFGDRIVTMNDGRIESVEIQKDGRRINEQEGQRKPLPPRAWPFE